MKYGNKKYESMKKIITLFALLVISCSSVLAQSNVTLTQKDKDALTERIKEKLDDFQDELKIVVGGKEKSTKQAAVTTALKLFIGEGNKYLYTDNNSVEKWHKAVQMQTSSKRRGIKTQSMKSYLSALTLMQGYRYDKVTIDQADAVRVGNISSVGNGKYVAIASICQHFCGYKDGRLVINDYDVKTVKVYINKIEYQTPDGKVVIWDARLGDFKVTETWH